MKRVKLKFVGFWKGFNETRNIYYDTLTERYDVELSDAPDYVIASMMGNPLDYLKYNDSIRIFHSGEDFFPDMNVFDYAAGYDDFVLKGVSDHGMVDRYFHWPYGCEWKLSLIKKDLEGKSREEALSILNKKKFFCNYIYGHPSHKGKREQLLEALSNYKRVDSAGVYRNNMPDGLVVDFNDKIDFIKNYKFSIAAETVQYPGMTTEKIYDAFRAGCIPIYYGNPFVMDTFNERSFVYWDGNKENLEKTVEEIIEIDNDDDRFVSMLMEPKIKKEKEIDRVLNDFKEWLYSIFDYDKEDVMQHMRRHDYSLRVGYENKLIEAFEPKRSWWNGILKRR